MDSAGINSRVSPKNENQSQSPSKSPGLPKSHAQIVQEEFLSLAPDIENIAPQEILMPFKPNCIQLTSDQRYFLFGSMEGRVAMVDRFEKEIIRDVPLEGGALYSIALYNSDKYVLSAGKDGIIRKFLVSNFSLVGEFKGHQDQLNSIFISHDQKWLFSASDDKTIRKWDIEHPQSGSKVLYEQQKAILVTDYSKDGMWMVSGGFEQLVYVYSFKHESVVKRLDGPTSSIWTIKISDSLEYLAAGGNDLNVRVWKFGTWDIVKVIKAHEKRVSNIVFTPDDRYVISSSNDFSVKIWSIHQERNQIVLDSHKGWVKSMIYLNSTEEFVTAGEDLKLIIWKIPPLLFQKRIEHHTQQVYKLCYSQFRNLVFANSDDHTISAWNLDTFRLEYQLIHDSGLYALYLSPDQTFIYSCTDNNDVIKWDLRTRQINSQYTNPQGSVRTILVTDFGDLITGDTAFRVTVRDANTFEQKTKYVFHNKTIWSMVLNSDQSLLFTGSQDTTIRLLDMIRQKQAGKLQGHKDRIKDMKLSSDDTYLFSSSKDNTIKVWNIKDLECIKTLSHHTNSVGSIMITPDEQFLIAGSADQSVSITSLVDYKLITSFKMQGAINSIIEILDRSYWFMIEMKNLYIMQNPFTSSKISVIGPENNKYSFLKYIKSLMSGYHQDYNSEMDKLLIMPYAFNSMHIYSNFNLRQHIKKGMENNSPLINSAKNLTPLSLAVKRNLSQIVQTMLFSLRKTAEESPYCLRILGNVMIDLNQQGFDTLDQIYDALLIKNTRKQTPKFCSYNVKLPIVYSSDIFDIEAEKFMSKNELSKEGKAIQFLSSAIQFQTEVGSAGSLEFLRSIMNCPTKDIFRTKLIRTLLQRKWKQVRWIMFVQGIIYYLYLLCLTLFAILSGDSGLWFLYIAFFINIFLVAYQIYQIFVAGLNYWRSTWNYIDWIRGFLLVVFTYQQSENIDIFSHLVTILFFISWLRGITYFRLFKQTRYMINLLVEVTKDIIPFLLILSYVTLAFAVLFSVLNDSDIDFGLFFMMSYQVNLGEFQTGDFDVALWVVFVCATLVNTIMMLNMLIAIMNDTYDRVQDGIEVADKVELTQMIIECEQLLLAKRRNGRPTYYQVCQLQQRVKVTQFNWEGRIRELKKISQKIQQISVILYQRDMLALRKVGYAVSQAEAKAEEIMKIVKPEEEKKQ